MINDYSIPLLTMIETLFATQWIFLTTAVLVICSNIVNNFVLKLFKKSPRKINMIYTISPAMDRYPGIDSGHAKPTTNPVVMVVAASRYNPGI